MTLRKEFIITDSRVASLYPDAVRLKEKDVCIVIPEGEESKTLATAEHIIGRLLEMRADRDSVLVGIGGGVVCDLAGFVASVFKRGTDLVLEPTTLLAQVDAAHGGKNGVDAFGLKNQIGCFKMPLEVRIRKEYLRTLPQREYLGGIAEMLKTFLISDAALYRSAAAFFKDHNDVRDLSDPSVLESLGSLVDCAASIKRAIVGRDPYDRGERMLLNFGHTFGHAIELHSGLTHGEAVAAGMVTAMGMSPLPAGRMEEVKEDFARIGLPTASPVKEADLREAILNDKKIKGGVLRMVLLEDIGRAVIRQVTV